MCEKIVGDRHNPHTEALEYDAVNKTRLCDTAVYGSKIIYFQDLVNATMFYSTDGLVTTVPDGPNYFSEQFSTFTNH